MLELNEKNFKEEIKKYPRVLIMFFVEEGCPHCKVMKPIFEAHKADGYQLAKYAGDMYMQDEITRELGIDTYPCFVAYQNGEPFYKRDGRLSDAQLPMMFTPEKLPAKPIPVKKATMAQLVTDEMILIDQLAPVLSKLKEIQKEIKRRKDLIDGKSCCESCASGGECEGGGCH